MEIVDQDKTLSEEIDYKKLKSDWDTFNNQDDYKYKRPDRFFKNIVKIARTKNKNLSFFAKIVKITKNKTK